MLDITTDHKCDTLGCRKNVDRCFCEKCFKEELVGAEQKGYDAGYDSGAEDQAGSDAQNN